MLFLMNQFVARLLKKEAGGKGRYYRQLKRNYLQLNWLEKTVYKEKAKAMLALYKTFK